MKIVRYETNGEILHGILQDDRIHAAEGDIFTDPKPASDSIAADGVRLLAPVAPSKLVCIGLNYTEHAEESNLPLPEIPMLFMCSNAAIVGNGEEILLDSPDARIDFEAEIAIVVGRKARNVKAADAQAHILGYTCCNDVSNRNMQKKDGQFTRAKSFDTYKPLGPVIETEMNPDNADIKLWQNGELRQSSNTSDMIFSIGEIFEFVSGIMTLLPGDLIITGTPAGVGPMKSGDRIEVEVAGIGKLSNPVK